MQDIKRTTDNQLEYHHSKHHTLAYVIPLAIIFIGLGGYLYWSYHHKTSGIDRLKQLDAASRPVTTTPDQQVDQMKTLEKTSVHTSAADQKAMLDALRK